MEILAKLNPAAQKYDTISSGTSGLALSGLDIAAALSMAKLRPLAYHYARAKYALDTQARLELFKCLVNVAKRNWGDNGGEALVEGQAGGEGHGGKLLGWGLPYDVLTMAIHLADLSYIICVYTTTLEGACVPPSSISVRAPNSAT